MYTYCGGGGGAGGVIHTSLGDSYIYGPAYYQVAVGAGGQPDGGYGADSSFGPLGITDVLAHGGGCGGSGVLLAGGGGSGGGAGGLFIPHGFTEDSFVYGRWVPEGNNGYLGGGGSGASGSDLTGGPGLYFALTGNSTFDTYYGGGGGSGTRETSTTPPGGIGGGGSGGGYSGGTNSVGGDGSSNSGGGGGGGGIGPEGAPGLFAFSGGNGGSGIVILRYQFRN